jgi:Fur family ferric uptake transcriptional regulator
MISYPLLLEQFKMILKENHLKFTKQREVILHFLYQNHDHFTPEEILMGLKEIHPKMSLGMATIYRTLTLLEESGIASSISFGAQGKKYELGVKKHHDHLICSACGKIIEFYDETIEAQQELIAQKFHFTMQEHTMKIVGLCQQCQEQTTI